MNFPVPSPGSWPIARYGIIFKGHNNNRRLALNRLLPIDRGEYSGYRGDIIVNNSVQCVMEISYDYYYRSEIYKNPSFSAGPYLHEPLRAFGMLILNLNYYFKSCLLITF